MEKTCISGVPAACVQSRGGKDSGTLVSRKTRAHQGRAELFEVRIPDSSRLRQQQICWLVEEVYSVEVPYWTMAVRRKFIRSLFTSYGCAADDDARRN